MQGFWSKLIRWAKVSKAGTDAGRYPVQQVVYLGKAADAVMLFPYGMHANVDPESIGPLLIMGGNMENRAMLPTSMTARSQLAEGDVEIYSPVGGGRVTIRANGSIEVDAGTGSVSITAGTVEITGDVTVTGTLEVTGTITNNGTDIGENHVHSGVTSGGSNTGSVV